MTINYDQHSIMYARVKPLSTSDLQLIEEDYLGLGIYSGLNHEYSGELEGLLQPHDLHGTHDHTLCALIALQNDKDTVELLKKHYDKLVDIRREFVTKFLLKIQEKL